jgi:uncharacterized protein YukE
MENMTKMIFKKLLIFSSNDKKAKAILFSEGKNIITSSSIDGTDRGKSVIMKSLYHTLGGDCRFDAKWNDNDKTYIVNISVDENEYYIYRCNRLFKAFDKDLNLLFKTIDRQDLASNLVDIFDFAVKLPDRNEEKLEITPPAFNYLLYFLDQDQIDGPYFTSFSGLGQYLNFKENTLFYHFGVFDDEYYNIMRKLEKLKEDNQSLIKKKELTEEMLQKVITNINGVSYSSNIDLLKSDVERSKEKYNNIAKTLSNIRTKLINLRNEKEELARNLESLKQIDKVNEKQIKALVNHTCPFCQSEVSDTVSLKINKYNTADDIILLSNDLQISISTVENKIMKQENEYKEWLKKLKEYEESLGEKSTAINDVLKHKGYMEVKDNLISDIDEIDSELAKNATKEKENNDKIRKYNDTKKEINQTYYELMLTDKNKFGLEEINAKSFENITRVFSAGGSNKPISTVIWYVNLIKIKNKFNPNAICFPVVFDSPNNAETDTDKKIQVYKYLVDNIDEKNQLIVSGIGYDEETFDGITFDKTINLDNAKYELLCDEDYKENVGLLRILCDK